MFFMVFIFSMFFYIFSGLRIAPNFCVSIIFPLTLSFPLKKAFCGSREPVDIETKSSSVTVKVVSAVVLLFLAIKVTIKIS